jgi:hypothetical protein
VFLPKEEEKFRISLIERGIEVTRARRTLPVRGRSVAAVIRVVVVAEFVVVVVVVVVATRMDRESVSWTKGRSV